MDAQQQTLDFTSRRNDLLALIARIRDLPVDRIGLSPGRANGVVELLQRLVLLSKEITDDQVQAVAQVAFLGARMMARSIVSEKTVRNWRRDAEALGLLLVDFRAQKYGKREWNVWLVSIDAVRRLVTHGRATPPPVARSILAESDPPVAPPQGAESAPPRDQEHHQDGDGHVEPAPREAGSGRKWPVTVTGPGPVTVTGPYIVKRDSFNSSTERQRAPERSAATKTAEDEGEQISFEGDEGEIRRLRNTIVHGLRLGFHPKPADLNLVVKVARLMQRGDVAENAVYEALEAIERKSLDRPIAYFQTCLDRSLGGDGELNRLLARMGKT
jgi:hypothetical protein